MRILHLIHTPRHSGAEILVRELCVIHRGWGHVCGIASFSPLQPAFCNDAIELQEKGVALFFPECAKVKFGRIVWYRQAILRFQPDVIFAHSVLPSLYGRFAVPKLFFRRSRFVSVLHAASNSDFGPTWTAMSHAERFSRSLVDHVIAVSEEGAKNYCDCFGESIPVSVVKNGIDIKRYSGISRQMSRLQHGLGDNQRVALQVGRICDVKQQHLSLAALKPLLASGKVQLWFAGLTEDAEYEKTLRRHVDFLGYSQNVRFLGSCNNIPELLAVADLYLMPSKQEAHSIALLEALASGVPVVASDIPAFSFARDMPNVRLCSVSDEVAWAEAAEAMIFAPRAQRNISEYSIDYTAKKYSKIAELYHCMVK